MSCELRVGLLKPRWLRQRVPPHTVELVDALAELRIGEQPLDVLTRGSPQDRPGIVGEVPQDGIEGTPDLFAAVVAWRHAGRAPVRPVPWKPSTSCGMGL